LLLFYIYCITKAGGQMVLVVFFPVGPGKNLSKDLLCLRNAWKKFLA